MKSGIRNDDLTHIGEPKIRAIYGSPTPQTRGRSPKPHAMMRRPAADYSSKALEGFISTHWLKSM